MYECINNCFAKGRLIKQHDFFPFYNSISFISLRNI